MDNSKSVVSSGAYGIPKWILKKGMRYEVDDFIVSPPSIDDGGFMRLRYGRSSTHDTNTNPNTTGTLQDGGMTVEVRDDTTLQFSSDVTPTNTTISIGPGGLSVESSPNTTPLTTPETSYTTQNTQHPLLVLPMNFGGEPKFVVKVDPPPTPPPQQQPPHNHNKDPLGPTAQAKEATTPETPETPENQHQHLHLQHHQHLKHQDRTQPHYSSHSSILEKIQSLSLNTTPSSSSVPSPVTSPITTPKASPTFNRKLLHMEPPQRKISAHSYFCTKQYLDQSSLSIKEEETVKQVDERALPPQALDPKMMGKRRRQPKPSTLREMNFWAPTSM